MAHALNWFEIPVTDMARAKKFYSAILDSELTLVPGMDDYYLLPSGQGEVGGAVGVVNGTTPGSGGVIVYLNGGDDLNTILNRVEGAGGSIITAKMNIGENGNIAWFKDTEGNTVGLHSMG